MAAYQRTPVYKFEVNPQVNPLDPELVKKIKDGFKFKFTDQKGKDWEYSVEVKNEDISAYTYFYHAIIDAKKKSALPWTLKDVRNYKDKVLIINAKDDAIQTELALKVAGNFLNRR